jgi:hypothetical protein
MGRPPPLPVPYETLVEQLRTADVLLSELREAEQSPKVRACIERVEAARLRMLAALRALP